MALTNAVRRTTAQRGRDCDLEARIKALDDRGPDEAARVAGAKAITATVSDGEVAARRLERIIAGNELTDVNYLERGVISGCAVARILIRRRGRVVGYGTGFLVAPGVLMTNHHVLDRIELVAESSAQFRYEYGLDGTELAPAEFKLRTDVEPILHLDNDLAVVGVEPQAGTGESIEQFGWLRLDPTPGKAVLGEYLTVIQHPGGERKQVCVRENRLIHYDPDGHYVWYQTDTVGGSSGSPVFNNSWDVVGLHHSGVARTGVTRAGNVFYKNRAGKRWTPDQGDDAIDWYANEGIRISRILQYLNDEQSASALARQVLGTPSPPGLVGHHGVGGLLGSPATGYSLPLSVPLTVRIGGGDSPSIGVGPTHPGASAPDLFLAPTQPVAGVDFDERAVVVDQSDYAVRGGFDPTFLGDAARLRVMMPIVTATAQGSSVRIGGRTRFHYWNYSVQMNADRRLAYLSAANVDPSLGKGKRPEDDNWFLDPRIGDDEALQLGQSFYGGQRDFEARELNPFDRGHLTSRQDLQWGATEAEAFRNGDDSYHFTNCAPQHYAFNQNRTINGLWRGLEVYVVAQTGGRRLAMINGPVFDAPLSREVNGVIELRPDGAASADPTFGGVAIPKLFYKIIAWRTDRDRLATAGFVVTQENVLRMVDRIVWPAVGLNPNEAGLTDEEVFLYQVPISRIAALTGIRFGNQLMRHDTDMLAHEAAGVGGLITALSDVRLFD